MATSDDAERYAARGVSADKGDVHKAIKNLDKGLFPKAFCKVVPDHLTGSAEHCIVMHADGAGTKSSLAYLYWKMTGDISVWRGIAQDALVMNIDDLLCVGAVKNILLSNTIGRNRHLVTGDVIAALIAGTEDLLKELQAHGVGIISTGGETADIGDLVRTVVVDSTVTARLRRDEIIDNGNIVAGDFIVGLASSGQASYEREYNSGIGSNGLTAARHDTFSRAELAARFPESFDPGLKEELVYSGSCSLTELIDVDDQRLAASSEPPQAKRQKGTAVPAGKLMLSPTRTYAPVVRAFFEAGLRTKIHGMIHCSGGGQTKILHFLSNGLHVVKGGEAGSRNELFPVPPVFRLIQNQSKTDWREMYKVFNMGHRLELYVPDEEAARRVIEISKRFNIDAKLIGKVESGVKADDAPRVTIKSEHGEFTYTSA